MEKTAAPSADSKPAGDQEGHWKRQQLPVLIRSKQMTERDTGIWELKM